MAKKPTSSKKNISKTTTKVQPTSSVLSKIAEKNKIKNSTISAAPQASQDKNKTISSTPAGSVMIPTVQQGTKVVVDEKTGKKTVVSTGKSSVNAQNTVNTQTQSTVATPTSQASETQTVPATQADMNADSGAQQTVQQVGQDGKPIGSIKVPNPSPTKVPTDLGSPEPSQNTGIVPQQVLNTTPQTVDPNKQYTSEELLSMTPAERLATGQKIVPPGQEKLKNQIQSTFQQVQDAGVSEDVYGGMKSLFEVGQVSPQEYQSYLNGLLSDTGHNHSHSTVGILSPADAAQAQQQSQEMMDYLNSIFNPPESGMSQWVQKGYAESLNNLMANMADGTATSADLAKLTLMQTLNYAINDEQGAYLDQMAAEAKSAYESALQQGKVGLSEIDKAIDGELTTATTYEGLQAKVLQEQKSFALEGIQIEADYMEKQWEAEKAQDDIRNARLEGYLKAKLISMGALDSTAGLTLISENLHMAQMEMDAKQARYDYNRAQLNLQSRQVMSEYTNNIQTMLLDAEAKKSEALSTYQTTISDIQKERLANSKEKQESMLTALSTYQTFLTEEDEKLYTRQQAEAEFAYKKQQDAISNAFNMSGMTGYMYGVDAEGKLYNSGIPTMEWSQYQTDHQLEVAKLNMNQNNEVFNQTMQMVDAMSTIAQFDPSKQAQIGAMIENQMGLAQGSLNAIAPEDWTDYLSGIGAGRSLAEAGLNETTLASLQNAYGAPLTSSGGYSLRIDPLDIPYVTEDLIKQYADFSQYFGMTSYAQSGAYNGDIHDGLDLVFRDGQVHSFTSGTVIEVQPWDGSDPYGGHVFVQDEYGVVYMYGHMGSNVNEYDIQVGQKINVGDTLGLMGNTGHSSGAHTHFSVIGAVEVPGVMDPSGAFAGTLGTAFNGSAWQNGDLGALLSGLTIDSEAYSNGNIMIDANGNAVGTAATITDPNSISDAQLDYDSKAEIKNYKEVLNYYSTIEDSMDGGASDVDLIYSYMKILDPTSVVREGEVLMLQNSQNLSQKTLGWFNKVQNGGYLPQEVRLEMLQSTKDKVEAAYEATIPVTEQYQNFGYNYNFVYVPNLPFSQGEIGSYGSDLLSVTPQSSVYSGNSSNAVTGGSNFSNYIKSKTKKGDFSSYGF